MLNRKYPLEIGGIFLTTCLLLVGFVGKAVSRNIYGILREEIAMYTAEEEACPCFTGGSCPSDGVHEDTSIPTMKESEA